jgi:hypothetical protein
MVTIRKLNKWMENEGGHLKTKGYFPYLKEGRKKKEDSW